MNIRGSNAVSFAMAASLVSTSITEGLTPLHVAAATGQTM
jgi:hypothetical protein